jgi:hypothetical protein
VLFAPCNILEGNTAVITIVKATFTLNPAVNQACFMSATSGVEGIETMRFHFA